MAEMNYGMIKSTWSSVELNLYCVHLFRLNPDVSLTVKHYSGIRTCCVLTEVSSV